MKIELLYFDQISAITLQVSMYYLVLSYNVTLYFAGNCKITTYRMDVINSMKTPSEFNAIHFHLTCVLEQKRKMMGVSF